MRPENIRLTESDAAGAIPARIDLIEELGASRLVHLSSPLGTVIASVMSEPMPLPSALGFVLSPERVSLYDRASGCRIIE